MHQDHPAGAALRETRKAQNLTLRELADMAGVDHSMLSRVERGEVTPSDRWLKSVTDALGLNMAGAA